MAHGINRLERSMMGRGIDVQPAVRDGNRLSVWSGNVELRDDTERCGGGKMGCCLSRG